MDDIVLVSSNRREMDRMIGKLEEFCNNYGMKVSDKSVYTYLNSKRVEREMRIQGATIKTIRKEEAYKYLGYWTALDGRWKKHKEEAEKKHQATLNLLKAGSIDARLKVRAVNVIANTPLEYGFHSVPYSEKELEAITVKNKRLAKRAMGASIRIPTTMLKLNNTEGGMGLRDLAEVYREINSRPSQHGKLRGQKLIILQDKHAEI